MVISPFASSDDASRDRRQNVAAVDDGGEIGERHEVRGGVGADPRTGAPGADGGPKDQIPPRRQRPITPSDGNDGQRVADLGGDEDGVVDGRRKRVVAEENVRVAVAQFAETVQRDAPEKMAEIMPLMRIHRYGDR